MAKALLIMKCGGKLESLAAVAGDFEDWIVRGMQWQGPVQICRVHEGDILPAADNVAGVVITGSGAMVTDHEPWMEIAADWLRKAQASMPILGICFGHQLLAYALGGDVAYNPKGVEVGRVDLHLTASAANDPLLQGLPSVFPANVSHMQSVVKLPPQAIHLASSAMEANQGFRVGERAWGVQFHPEFSAGVMPYYIDNYHDALQQQGRDGEELKQSLGETSPSQSLLQRFAQLLEKE